jgi:hemerythrin-like metal-binding protein
MEWTPTLATGQVTLDDQHRGLFKCLADLETAATEERTLFAVYTLTRLKHYVSDHFTTEEAMMRKSNYPNLKQHIDEHEQFRMRLRELQISSVHADISTTMVEFLRDWLVNHIAKSDMDYVPYLVD